MIPPETSVSRSDSTIGVHPIGSYSFTSSDALLLDANVWLYIHGPLPLADPFRPWTRAYSFAWKRILEAGCRVFIDALVLSEIVNRWARAESNRTPESQRPRNFKECRSTSSFAPVARDIAATCRTILRSCVRTETAFETADMGSVLEDFERGRDINDLLLIQLCAERALKLVTHDRDFRGAGITLISANRAILKL